MKLVFNVREEDDELDDILDGDEDSGTTEEHEAVDPGNIPDEEDD